ncbi:hypothetical protein [Flavobacterium sp. 3HN19-14]|uniref:hypothetical protein n=1 Tax=Flavobacterium sp. 3HN19-14 TaxID=3448133 RepID=UPI003EE3CC54
MKKKINVVLIIIVSCLWGTVLYRYVNQYFFRQDFTFPQKTAEHASVTNFMQKDTFVLSDLNRDPFLNKLARKPNVLSDKVLKVKKQPVVKKEVKKVNFPSITYLGYIKTINKNEELVLLKVNGSLMKLKTNQLLDGLKVLKIYKDSVRVSYMDEADDIKKIIIVNNII